MRGRVKKDETVECVQIDHYNEKRKEEGDRQTTKEVVE